MFRQPPKPEVNRDAKLIKNYHTRSGIACLPGAFSYRAGSPDQRSPIRQQMFSKRNRSLVFAAPEQESEAASQQRLALWKRKQLTSAFQSEEPPASAKKRSPSPWACRNESSALRSLMRNEASWGDLAGRARERVPAHLQSNFVIA